MGFSRSIDIMTANQRKRHIVAIGRFVRLIRHDEPQISKFLRVVVLYFVTIEGHLLIKVATIAVVTTGNSILLACFVRLWSHQVAA